MTSDNSEQLREMEVGQSSYAVKDSEYFSLARAEILPLLPQTTENVLELGCGAGATLRWLKTVRDVKTATGIELMPEPAERARSVADAVYCQDIEVDGMPSFKTKFDTVLCLDVLEHLRDPWGVLKDLVNHAVPHGVFIFSIPNVRNWKVTWNLVAKGRFEYQDHGILDRTHVRFFVRKSMIELVESAGLECIAIVPRLSKKGEFLNSLSLNLLSEHLAAQYLISARRKPTTP
jgi:2-polyprenyl-3-methyl-5-hydroxy-6-metoxy-1,4-benzoquinol methylase